MALGKCLSDALGLDRCVLEILSILKPERRKPEEIQDLVNRGKKVELLASGFTYTNIILQTGKVIFSALKGKQLLLSAHELFYFMPKRGIFFEVTFYF